MKRRAFIQKTASLALLPFALNALKACATHRQNNKILVIIQLIGGNDGLNTLIPLDNYSLLKAARPKIIIPEDKILPLKGCNTLGLHPSMNAIQDLFAHSQASFVQGVGYENPSYSHFRSTDIWTSGSDASKLLDSGWIARYLETIYSGYPVHFPNNNFPAPPAIKIGDTGTGLFQSKVMDMGIIVNPYEGIGESFLDTTAREANSPAGNKVGEIRKILNQTKLYAPLIRKAFASNLKHSDLYPKTGVNSLADQLKMVSRSIHSGIETPVYVVSLKGFDTHNDQVDSSNATKGAHALLLKDLSNAIAAFWDDMIHIGRENDVLGMTFSEFGRRIKSNGSFGTDHGSAQPILLFGNRLKKRITGSNPTISKHVTSETNLDFEFDFRQLYVSILQDWFNVTESNIAKIMYSTQHRIDLF